MNKYPTQFERVPRRGNMWRIFHWATVFSIVAACLTGTYIADPFFGLHGHDVMSWMRAFHFYVAIILDCSVISLAYLYFFSRTDRGVEEIIPTKKNFVSLQEGFLNLVLLNGRKKFDSSKPDSWNAMWFTVLHLLVFFQMFTGFQLYVINEYSGVSSIGGWWPQLLHTTTDWTVWLFGSQGGVRTAHLVTMYFIIAWAMCHLYYEAWRTIVWREGDIGIAIGGYKFARRPPPVSGGTRSTDLALVAEDPADGALAAGNGAEADAGADGAGAAAGAAVEGSGVATGAAAEHGS
ncbi:MAG: cytochrome b/b6 domain-containing protein [Solirubrobacteraceae bacterium]